MKALLRKEVRLLLPAWVVAILLAALPAWIFRHLISAFDNPVWMAFIPGIMLISLSSFGQEFSGKTFSLLLAQPVSRSRIWNVKISLLCIALLSCWMVFRASNFMAYQSKAASGEMDVLLWNIGIIAMVSTALWTMMLFRQVTAAFWISLLLPPVMATLLIAGLEWLNPTARAEQHLNITTGLLAVYSVVGVVAARRLYFRAQDVVWTGGDVSIAAIPIPFVNSAFRRGTFGRWRKVVSLFKKELQLQQMSLMFALGGLAAHLISLLLRKFVHVSGSGITATLIDKSWIFAWICWAVLPMFSGSVAVAEERKLGTLEGHLCLPVSRELQFFVKLATVMLISVGLGFGLLYSFEWIGAVIGVHGELLSNGGLHGTLWVLALGWAWMGLIATYCSSLTRNALQALGATVVAWAASGMLYGLATDAPRWNHVPLWRGLLGLYVIGMFMTTALVVLAWFNFKHVHSTKHLLVRNLNLLAVTILVASGVTAFAYHRTWELFPPLEPKHGPSRISASAKFKIVSTYGRFVMVQFVLFPDGRLWKSTGYEQFPNRFPKAGAFLGESNWMDVGASDEQVAAIRSDGSLWSLYERYNWWRKQHGIPLRTNPDMPYQIGNGTGWKKLAGGSVHMLGLKDDGTLWGWGFDGTQIGTPGNNTYSLEPARIGNESDWKDIFAAGSTSIGVKQDGSVWWWGAFPGGDIVMSQPVRWNLGESNIVSFAHAGWRTWFTTTDGSLWSMGQAIPSNRPNRMDSATASNYLQRTGMEDLQNSETGTHWFGVFRKDCLFLLKDDGTLWTMDSQMAVSGVKLPLIQIGTQSDWITTDDRSGLCMALARDGRLYSFLPDASYYMGPLLRPTRLPIRSLNILDSPTEPWTENPANVDK